VVHPIVQRRSNGCGSGGGGGVVAQKLITRRFDGREERGLVGQGDKEEFCMKVLKFEIVNSQNVFNYFSRVVPRTIEFVQPVTLFPDRTTLDL
jgi:hypothetical protein